MGHGGTLSPQTLEPWSGFIFGEKGFKKGISTVWRSSSLCWKGYFGRRRNKNTGLIENTDESCCPLFQTDEKTRERRENPHEFMHQSCHTSGHGTLIGGRFVPRGTPRTLSMKERWWLAATIKCSCHSGASREIPIMIHDEIKLFHSPQKFPSTDLEANQSQGQVL